LRRFTNIANASKFSLDEGADLDNLAEQELMKCAKIIADATKSLDSFQMPAVKKGPNQLLNLSDINASIMEAATLIAKATAQLVQASVVAQRDRSQEAKAKGGSKYHADPMWANGLISASQGVAGSVQELVAAANVVSTQGKGEEERLIASARGVAASTAHLVAASRTKADPNSISQKSLQIAAKAVAQATAKLVASAQAYGMFEEANKPEENFDISGQVVGGVRVEMEQNIKIMNLEKQLEQERIRQQSMRKDKYKK